MAQGCKGEKIGSQGNENPASRFLRGSCDRCPRMRGDQSTNRRANDIDLSIDIDSYWRLVLWSTAKLMKSMDFHWRIHFRYMSKRSRDRTSIPRNEQSALPWVTLLRYDRNRAHDSQTRASMFKWTRRIAFYFLCSSTKADLAESSLAKLNRTTDS